MPDCWTCRHQELKGPVLLGICRYFERLGRPPREIPADVVDKGCKFYEAKTGPGESNESRD